MACRLLASALPVSVNIIDGTLNNLSKKCWTLCLLGLFRYPSAERLFTSGTSNLLKKGICLDIPYL